MSRGITRVTAGKLGIRQGKWKRAIQSYRATLTLVYIDLNKQALTIAFLILQIYKRITDVNVYFNNNHTAVFYEIFGN